MPWVVIVAKQHIWCSQQETLGGCIVVGVYICKHDGMISIGFGYQNVQ